MRRALIPYDFRALFWVRKHALSGTQNNIIMQDLPRICNAKYTRVHGKCICRCVIPPHSPQHATAHPADDQYASPVSINDRVCVLAIMECSAIQKTLAEANGSQVSPGCESGQGTHCLGWHLRHSVGFSNGRRILWMMEVL